MMTAWHRFRADVQAALIAGMADEYDRRTWSADRIARAQRAGLRVLLQHAMERSPFHRERLAGIDVVDVDPADMSELPVMTKSQMMDGLDNVLADRRLDRGVVEAALANTGAEPVVILDDYIALASGGCSGQRGIFVLDRAAVAAFVACSARQPGPVDVVPGAAGGQTVMALVAAPSAVHATGMLAALMSGGTTPIRSALVPATQPLGEIVERLNAMQPAVLTGYASMLVRLAAEADAGRLNIAPTAVSSTSETLLPEMRSVIRDAFGGPFWTASARPRASSARRVPMIRSSSSTPTGASSRWSMPRTGRWHPVRRRPKSLSRTCTT